MNIPEINELKGKAIGLPIDLTVAETYRDSISVPAEKWDEFAKKIRDDLASVEGEKYEVVVIEEIKVKTYRVYTLDEIRNAIVVDPQRR